MDLGFLLGTVLVLVVCAQSLSGLECGKESRDPSTVRKDHGAVYAQLKRESVLIVCSFEQLDLAKGLDEV